MKKIISILILTAVLLSSVMILPSNAAYDEQMNELELYSDCAYLVSADNGEVIFDKNAGMQTAPASLTKIVTAIVVLAGMLNALKSLINDSSADAESKESLMNEERPWTCTI